MSLKWRIDSVCNVTLQMILGAMDVVRSPSLRAARLQSGVVIQAFGFNHRRGMGERSATHLWRIRKQRMMGYAALTHPTLATLAFFIVINQALAKASTLQPSDWDYAHCSLLSKEQEGMPAVNRSQIQVLGKGLREDLNNIYNKLSNDATNPISENNIEVNATFLKYIKTGMKFSDAESILSVAGFSVDAKPSFVFYRNGGKDEMLFFQGAQIEPFSQHFLGRTNLIVLLFPQKNSDFSRVCNLSASFLEATL